MGASDPEMMSTGADAIGARPSGNGPQPGPGFEVRSPADGSVVASLPDQGAEEVRAAVARLRRNQPAWEALGPTGRGEWVGRLRDWLFDNDERVAELLQRETGKPWQEATLEVPFAIDLLEYYRKRAEKFLADSHPRPHDLLTASKKLTIAYRPYPVVGRHLPVEQPRPARPGRCGARAVGRRGGRHQAVRAHPAGHRARSCAAGARTWALRECSSA